MGIKGIIAIVGASLIPLGFAAVMFLPQLPRTMAGWMVLIGLGVPAYIFFEWFGGRVFTSRLFESIPSGVRVALGVPATLALIFVAYVLVGFIQNYIEKVGG